jgi:prepilin-type N-terminal cleavage/methylation domain-containing protein
MNTQTQSANGDRATRKERGFSLIELLIVVAIILIIAAIAIPNLVKARLAANEASAASSVRSIGTAEVAYAATYTVGYGTLANLGGAVPCTSNVATSCLLDPVLSAGTKSGYVITAAPIGGGAVAFVASAVPINVGVTGQRTFCNDETGVIRFDITGGGAPATDAACQVFPRIQ